MDVRVLGGGVELEEYSIGESGLGGSVTTANQSSHAVHAATGRSWLPTRTSDDSVPMGSLCSKSSAHEGGHTVLGSGPVNSNSGARSVPSVASPRPDPRAAAAEAAERRLQAAQKRGTSAANPKQGKLASQLAKQNSSKPGAQPQEEDRLVWD
ncbi:hypothetical protein BDZ97DRAFT_409219 [Flammula alnicola]|nr:hypothetical protein BDZ97DRAFT_409219 [Flammula alnicola]